MNHSRDGTISPASSSRLNFCSARRTFSPSSVETLIGGGRGSGMKAEIASPASVLFSYRPGCRRRLGVQGKDPCLVDGESKGSITKARRKARFLYEQRTRRGRRGGRRQREREAAHRARRAVRWSRGARRAARRPASARENRAALMQQNLRDWPGVGTFGEEAHSVTVRKVKGRDAPGSSISPRSPTSKPRAGFDSLQARHRNVAWNWVFQKVSSSQIDGLRS